MFYSGSPTITGIVVMLSPKRSGRHLWFGTIYYRCPMGAFATASALAADGLAEGYHRFILGTLASAAATPGSHGAPEALEQMGDAAYHRHGDVVHFAADYVPCGQWKRTCRFGDISLRLHIGWRPP
jgi:hypothetical protein